MISGLVFVVIACAAALACVLIAWAARGAKAEEGRKWVAGLRSVRGSGIRACRYSPLCPGSSPGDPECVLRLQRHPNHSRESP